MTDARTMSAIAARVVDFMESEFPDHDPLVLRGSLMSAGDDHIAFLHVADLLQSQAERIKELEAECEVERLRLTACGVAALGYFDGCKDEYKSASLDDVLRLNKRCTDLRAELGDLPEAQAEMLSEIKQLRAQLAEIAATEPVLVVEKEPDYWSGGHFHEGSKPHVKPTKVWSLPIGTKLFTRPMPAQDVTKLVDALEKLARLGNGDHYGNSDGNMIARDALSKYKGAK